MTPARHPLAGALLACLLVAGCEMRGDGRDPSPAGSAGAELCACAPGDARVVDPALLAFLSKARAAHHEADLVEKEDRPRAIRALERVADGPRPTTASGAPLPEVGEVLADTRARLADLRSIEGSFDAARLDVEQGLKLAAGPSHFRGHLVEMRGLVEERRAAALRAKGDLVGAEAARQAAISAFGEAIEIQDAVIQSALGDGGPAGDAPRPGEP